MVIDFLLFISRTSARQWSLISLCHNEALYKAIVMIFLIIEALCEAMVIDFLCHIEALYEAMVIDLFTSRPSSRPSARQWSSISLHQGPLRGNGHGSLYIKTLCEAMVIDFLCHIEALCEAMVIDLFTSRPSTRQW
ncbi:hypothetical protein DEO72_LG10g2308 [Vigna unguiculata]|uniref:Uncharacterized protein n=1 Tax=Vigna unguiculata TaxID=3917 RepID=A0A4D6NFX0_VIGUN|nr:hypothetical protein DEO72_LG10g2308 [Vigna unguiculata]